MKKALEKTPTTTVRLPPKIHAEVKAAAELAGHSMNTEIIKRLGAPIGDSLRDIARQNEKTQEMVQTIIDAITPRR